MPNITGGDWVNEHYNPANIPVGAFYIDWGGGDSLVRGAYGGNSLTWESLTFSANRSNNLYKNNWLVQPSSFLVFSLVRT